MRWVLIALALAAATPLGHAAEAPAETSPLDKLVTVEARDVELRVAVRAILDKVGADYVLPGDLKGRVSVSFTDLPARQALQVLLEPAGWTARVMNGSTVRIQPLKASATSLTPPEQTRATSPEPPSRDARKSDSVAANRRSWNVLHLSYISADSIAALLGGRASGVVPLTTTPMQVPGTLVLPNVSGVFTNSSYTSVPNSRSNNTDTGGLSLRGRRSRDLGEVLRALER